MTRDKHCAGWTNREEDALAAGWRAGISKNTLAADLGRTVSAIENRIEVLRRRGVDLPNRPKNGRHKATQEQTA